MSEQLLYCNECGKEKIYYNTIKEIGWCHFCQRPVFKKEVGLELGPEYLFDPEISDSKLPNYPFAWWREQAREYLERRWVTELAAIRVGIRFDEDRQSIRIPIHSPAVEFGTAYQTRGIREGSHWYTEATNRADYCFGWPWIPEERREVILVEGIFDVLSPGWLGYGVALLGTVCSDTLVLALSQRFDSVLLWLDPDAAGVKGSKRVASQLRTAGLEVDVISAGYEPGDMGPAHPDAIRIRERLESNLYRRHTHP